MDGGLKFCSVITGVGLVLFAGCQSGPQPRPLTELNDRAPNESQVSLAMAATAEQPSPSDVAPSPLPSNAPPELVPPPPGQAAPSYRLSLFDAVEITLAQNPDLVALRYA